ncbi:MAG: hypothetical protein J7513_11725 [Solirubrobacteraceae bacterium]|nr:hypothetical protein [Solirubrobacteraceae bacterium]
MNDDVSFALRRARIRRAMLPVLLLAAALVILGLTLQSVDDPLSGSTRGAVKVGGMVAALLAALGGWLLWRGLTVRVVITRSEVVLRNVGGTRRVPFREIAGFELHRTNEFGRPRTVLRLTAGRHGIPRSFAVAAASTETLAGAWLNLLFTGMVASGAGRVDADTFAPASLEKVPRGVAELIAEMNAALDARRGSGEQTAELLAAAHPKFRTILHDD